MKWILSLVIPEKLAALAEREPLAVRELLAVQVETEADTSQHIFPEGDIISKARICMLVMIIFRLAVG